MSKQETTGQYRFIYTELNFILYRVLTIKIFLYFHMQQLHIVQHYTFVFNSQHILSFMNT